MELQAIAIDPRENGALGALGGWAARDKRMDDAEAYYRHRSFPHHVPDLSCVASHTPLSSYLHAGVQLKPTAAFQHGTSTSLFYSTTRRETTKRACCCRWVLKQHAYCCPGHVRARFMFINSLLDGCLLFIAHHILLAFMRCLSLHPSAACGAVGASGQHRVRSPASCSTNTFHAPAGTTTTGLCCTASGSWTRL